MTDAFGRVYASAVMIVAEVFDQDHNVMSFGDLLNKRDMTQQK